MERFNGVGLGAKFIRADLHIHSFGDDGSYDVKDERMTPAAIVDAAIAAGLSIISITDHNEINNCRAAIEYASNKEILVLPGVEVSTTQGHLLAYFPDFASLRKFYGRLTISDDKERCAQGIFECLELIAQFGGFGVLAHIELSSGFEEVIGRFNEVMEEILCHPALLALEISLKEAVNRYTPADESPERRKIAAERCRRLGLGEDSVLPKIMSSDSHALDKLGRNAANERKLTRFKLDELSFNALRIALFAHESRVRLESYVPERVPNFIGLTIKGGVLDGAVIRFSKNLNCVIGGRGTGKSTLLESIREAAGHDSNAPVVDSEVWPDEIALLYEDETGGIVEFRREKNYYAYNNTDPEEGISSVPLAIWGQGDVSEVVKNCDEDPAALLKFLDDFIDIGELKAADEELVLLLRENRTRLSKLRADVGGIPDTAAQIKNLEAKVKRLEEDKVGELVKYQTALITERNLREGLVEEIRSLVENYKEALSEKGMFDSFREMSDERIFVGKEQFTSLRLLVDEFSQVLTNTNFELNESLREIVEKMREQVRIWKGREAETQKKIDEQKAHLEAQGIPFDIGRINQIAVDLGSCKERLKRLQASASELKDEERKRTDLVAERKKLRQEIYKRRHLFALEINNNLRNAVDGLLVKCKYKEGCFSYEFEQQLKGVMGWRTTSVKRAALIASAISPLAFVDGVKRGDLSVLAEIIDEEGRRVFSDSDIGEIINEFSSDFKFEDVESLAYEDRPSINVTRVIDDPVKGRIHKTRLISQLSMGQQQSILLAILIQSKSMTPLLIDQPEDNLDGEFIYKTVVSNLKKIKEARQVVVVTHNANIAVLGDAELIIPLKSNGVKSQVFERGSIDRTATIDQCCEILEGGRQAFARRRDIYRVG
jgi:ABC-type lipoprotein export system ATPase subunit/histidinol phosphatase-like PHP family hydrolase